MLSNNIKEKVNGISEKNSNSLELFFSNTNLSTSEKEHLLTIIDTIKNEGCCGSKDIANKLLSDSIELGY